MFEIVRNGVVYEVLIEKRASDDDRPLKVTVTNKNDRTDSDYVITKDPGLIGCKLDLVPKFQEYFNNRTILLMQKTADGEDRISQVALSNIADKTDKNFSTISVEDGAPLSVRRSQNEGNQTTRSKPSTLSENIDV